jgi:hypothetical protein
MSTVIAGPPKSCPRTHLGNERSGEGVVPGFRCSVDALFPPAGPAEAAEAAPAPTAS